MLRRLFFISAILILAFTVTTFGQSNKRTLSKAKKVTQTKKGVSEWTDILARKTNKRKPNAKPFIGSPTDGNGIREAATSKSKTAQLKSRLVKKPNNFQVDQKLGMPDYVKKPSTNQRKSGFSNKRKSTKSTNLLPYMEQENLRKKGKYANQEVSYRKNKTVRRKNK
jgi:hypothetical protein